MLQFYFLSVLLNLLAGLIFIYVVKENSEASLYLPDSDDPFAENPSGASGDTFNTEEPSKSSGFKSLTSPFLADKTFQLVIGILSALTGLMKLLSPIQYDVPVVGDLVPALAGLVSGFVLLLDWYQERSDVELPLPEVIQNVYTGGRKYLGIFCLISALLHFIFPNVLFL